MNPKIVDYLGLLSNAPPLTDEQKDQLKAAMQSFREALKERVFIAGHHDEFMYPPDHHPAFTSMSKGMRSGELFFITSGPGKSSLSDSMYVLKQRQNSTEPNQQDFECKIERMPDGQVCLDLETNSWKPAKYEQAYGRMIRQSRNVVLLPCIELPVGKSRNVREGRYAFKVSGRHTRKKTPHQVKQLVLEAKVMDALSNKAKALVGMLEGKCNVAP